MKRLLVLAAALITVTGAPTSAQSWDAPMFFGPRPMDDLGLYVTRSDQGIGNATGLVGIWRQSGNLNLGVRAGVGDIGDAGNSLLVGAELYGGLNSLLPASGVDISWNLGAGAIFGDQYTFFSVPFGASIGMRLGSGSVQVTPYVHPRVSLDISAIGSGSSEQTDTDGSFAVDLGADVSLSPKWMLRAGYSLGDRKAFGVGLAMRSPRGVSVVR